MGVKDSAVGAILEIPAEAMNQIKLAEAEISNLGKVSERTAKRVAEHWGETAVGGLEKFISALKNARGDMEKLGNININLNTNNVQSQMSTAVNVVSSGASEVSKIIQDAAKTGWDFLAKVDISNVRKAAEEESMTIDGVIKKIKELEAEKKTAYATSRDSNDRVIDNTGVQRLSDEIKAWKEYLRILNEATTVKNAALAKMQEKTDADILKRQNQLLNDRIGLQEKISNLQASIKKNELTGNTSANKDLQDTLNGRLREMEALDNKIKSLNSEYARLSESGKAAFDERNIKGYNDWMDKTNGYFEKLRKNQEDFNKSNDKTYLDRQKEAYRQILDLRKQINEQAIKVKKGEITQSSTLEKDKKDLQELKDRLRAVGQEWKQYNTDAARGSLSSDASLDARTAKLKIQNEIIKEQRKYQEDLNKAITTANEKVSVTQAGKARLGNSEEAAVQRQLNSDYKEMLRIIKEYGEVRAKAASEGRSLTEQERNLVQALIDRYRLFRDDINRVSDSYKGLSTAAAEMFSNDKSVQLARNAVLFADATQKAAVEAQKLADAEAKATAKRDSQRLNQANADATRRATARSNAEKEVNDILAKRIELQQKITTLNTKRDIAALSDPAAKLNFSDSANLSKYERQMSDLEARLKSIGGLYPKLARESDLAFDTQKAALLALSLQKINEEQSKIINGQSSNKRDDAETRLNKLYEDRLRLLKEQKEIQNRGDLRKEQGLTQFTASENQRLTQINNQLQTNERQINNLASAYAGLNIKAKRAFDVKELQQNIDLANKFNRALDSINDRNVRNLLSEYKQLTNEAQRLAQAMREYTAAGGDRNSTAYTQLETRFATVMAQRREIEFKGIDEIEQYRQQRRIASYQDDLSKFIQAEAAKTAEAKKQVDERTRQQAIAQQKYLNSAQGAMWYSRQINKGHIDNSYENRAIAIRQLENAIKSLDANDKNYEKTLRQLTTTLNRLKKEQNEVKDATKPVVSSTEAINAAKTATNLKQLETAYKKLKEAMNNTKPDSTVWNQMNTLLGQTKTQIDDIKRKMGEFKTQSVNVSGIVGQLRNQIAMVFSASAINGYIRKLTEVRAQFELQNVALRAIIQNKDEADRIFQQVQNMALQSPFTIMQLTTYTKQLAAYNIESKKLVRTTKMLADVSAGLGVDFGRLSLAFGQVRSANYLRATELRQFTEAGLNMGKELADYFSEMKGEMVTVGDVMDLISKRMVRFEDVEEVFRRVTSEGGMFYDMQKKQSESLYGQIQRITDAYNIMMNDIGKSHQTTIGAALQLIRSLISNWRTVVNILQGASVAMLAYTIQTVKGAIANGTFVASQKGLVGALAATKDALLKVIAFVGKNPYLLMIAGVTAAAMALLDLRNKMRGVHEQYGRIVDSLSEQGTKLDVITKKINDNNRTLAETNAKVKSTKKGTQEYNQALDANKKALSEQYKSLEELRSAFPEVYNHIVKTKDGTIDLTNALEAFNRVKNMAAVITTLTDDDAHWYDDDFKTDLEDVSKTQEKYNAQLAKAEAYLNTYFAKAQAIYETRKATGELSDKDEVKFKAILDLANSELSVQEKIKKVTYDGYRGRDLWISALKNDVVNLDNAFRSISFGKKGWLYRDLRDDLAEAKKEADEFMERILTAAGVTSAEMFKSLPDETRAAATTAGQKVITELGLALDEVQRDIISRKIEIPLGIKFNFEEEGEQRLSYLQEQINKYIKEHPEVNMSEVKATDNTDQFFKNLKSSRESDLADQKQYEKAKGQIAEKGNAEAAKAAKEQAEARKKMMEYFGIEESKKKSGKGTDPWQKRVQLFRELNTEYEKLLQNYSKEEAKQRIQKSYAQAIAEIYKGQGKFANADYWMGFDKDSMIKMGQEMLDSLSISPEKRKDLEKQIASLKATVDVQLQKDAVENMKKDIQNVADNFELSETFRKLGVSTDLVFMLGGKPTTLADYKKYLVENYQEAVKNQEEYGEEGVKAYDDMLKKIEQQEQKSFQERAKNYAKYLANSYGDSAKVMLDYYTKLTEMQEDFDKYQKQLQTSINDPATSDADRSQMIEILKNLPEQSKRAAVKMREEMEKELAKLSLDKVLKSPLFSEMFQDLGSMTNSVLDRMIQKINDIRNSAKNLTLSQVRQLAQYAEKLENAKIDNSPFKEAAKAIQKAYELRSQGITARSASDSLAVSEEELARLEQYKEDLTFILGIKEQSYQIDGQNLIAGGQKVKLSNQQLSLIRKEKSELNDLLSETNDGIEKQQKLVTTNAQNVQVFKNAKTGTEKFGAALQEVAKLGMEAMNVITSGIQLFGGEVSESDQVWIDFVGNMLSTCVTLGIAFVALGIEINSALGIIGLIATALSAVTGLFTALFQAHDKRLEKQIDKVKKRVENLERAFEKLKTAIDNAFSFESADKNTDDAIANAKQNIREQMEIIRLNEEKKKKDQDAIDEARKKIQDLQDEIVELEKQRKEIFGGFGLEENIKSAAEEFADVWADGFKETGDGLSNLQDKFQEFAYNMLKKQVWGRLAEKWINPILTSIDDAFDSNGNMDVAKWANIVNNLKDINLENFNEQAKQIAEALGFKGGTGEFVLSDLQKGIQNITEPQAAAIKAYLNSMRFAVFRHTEQLDTLIATISMQYGSSESPMLTEVRGIRSVLDNIYTTLRSVVKTQTGRTFIQVG